MNPGRSGRAYRDEESTQQLQMKRQTSLPNCAPRGRRSTYQPCGGHKGTPPSGKTRSCRLGLAAGYERMVGLLALTEMVFAPLPPVTIAAQRIEPLLFLLEVAVANVCWLHALHHAMMLSLRFRSVPSQETTPCRSAPMALLDPVVGSWT